jgi:hypothetical protein
VASSCLLKGVGIIAGVPQTADNFAAMPKSPGPGHKPKYDACQESCMLKVVI